MDPYYRKHWPDRLAKRVENYGRNRDELYELYQAGRATLMFDSSGNAWYQYNGRKYPVGGSLDG